MKAGQRVRIRFSEKTKDLIRGAGCEIVDDGKEGVIRSIRPSLYIGGETVVFVDTVDGHLVEVAPGEVICTEAKMSDARNDLVLANETTGEDLVVWNVKDESFDLGEVKTQIRERLDRESLLVPEGEEPSWDDDSIVLVIMGPDFSYEIYQPILTLGDLDIAIEAVRRHLDQPPNTRR